MRPVFATISPYFYPVAIVLFLLAWWLVMRLRKAAGVWRLRYYAFPRTWLKFLHRSVPRYEWMPWELRAPYQDKVLQFFDGKRFQPCGELQEVTEEARIIIGGNACLLLLNETFGCFPDVLTVQLFPHGDPNADGGARSSAVALWWDAAKQQATDPRDVRAPLAEIAGQLGGQLPQPLLLTAWARVRAGEFSKANPGMLEQWTAGEPADVFAAATELFYASPAALRQKQPALYDALRHFYFVDPSRWSVKR